MASDLDTDSDLDSESDLDMDSDSDFDLDLDSDLVSTWTPTQVWGLDLSGGVGIGFVA